MRSNLKQLIAQWEQQHGEALTGEDLAERTGLNVGTISRWNQPRPFTTIKTDVILRLTAFFDCTLDDLLYIDRRIAKDK